MNITGNKTRIESKGYYSLGVFKEDGTEVKEKAINNVDNVVTFVGAFELLFSTQTYARALTCKVGNSTTERVRSDTTLGNVVGATSDAAGGSGRSGGGEVDNLDGTSTLTSSRTFNFGVGAIVGTISEVGMFVSATLVAGQLIKDEFDAPTTLTLLSDEQLRVVYTLEFIVPNGEGTMSSIGSGSVTHPRGTSTYEMYGQPYFSAYGLAQSSPGNRPSRSRSVYGFSSSSGSFKDGFTASSSAASHSHDGAGNVSVTYTTLSLSPSDYNATDIKYITVGGGSNDSFAQFFTVDTTTKIIGPADQDLTTAALAVEFSPALEKTNTESFSIQLSIAYTI